MICSKERVKMEWEKAKTLGEFLVHFTAAK